MRGQSPCGLSLTAKASSHRATKEGGAPKEKERRTTLDGHHNSERRSRSAAHKPQHIARFRKLGKQGFPNFRREADALHQRWEAKRPRELLLILGQGPDSKWIPNGKRHLAGKSRAATFRKTACSSP